MLSIHPSGVAGKFGTVSDMELLQVKNEVWKTIPSTFGKTKKILLEDIETLKQWMKTQPHLPELLDDKILENFLFFNKCDVKSTQTKIKLYYTARSTFPDLFKHINPKLPNMKETMEIIYWTPLPKLTPDMYRMIFFKMRNKTMVGRLEPLNVIRQYINIQEIRLKEDVMYGEIIIGDYGGFDSEYARKITPDLLALWVSVYEMFSMNVKHFFFINVSEWFDETAESIKKLMKPEVFEKVHICRDESILHEHFPKEMLPEDYGGEQPSLEELQNLLKTKFDKYQQRFDRLDTLKVDENLTSDSM